MDKQRAQSAVAPSLSASAISPDLPPCPYCGAPNPSSVAEGVHWVVACIGCPGRIIGRTRRGAESAWRARASDSELRRH